MTPDQVGAIARQVLTAAGTLLALAGIVPPDKWAAFSDSFVGAIAPIVSLVGTGTVIASTVWGYFRHSAAAKVTSTAALPGVKAVVVSPTAAGSVGALAHDPASPKVVAQGSAAASRVV